MKCVALALLLTGADAFLPSSALRSPARLRKAETAMQMSVGLFYSTTTGNTETVAGYIAEAGGLEGADISEGGVDGYDSIIFGAPTWHTGADTERSGTAMDEFLYNDLPGLDLKGKKVAIFGLGDQESYSDNFCDAAGEIYDCLTSAGATVVGMTSPDGYNHVESKAIRDGKFVGLMCDEDNEYDKSEERAQAWVEQLKGEGFAF